MLKEEISNPNTSPNIHISETDSLKSTSTLGHIPVIYWSSIVYITQSFALFQFRANVLPNRHNDH